MFDDDIIDMLEKALEKANDKDAKLSDFNNAVITVDCAIKHIKDKKIQEEAIFSRLKKELSEFVNIPDFLKKAKCALPSLSIQDFTEFCVNFLLFMLNDIYPLETKSIWF